MVLNIVTIIWLETISSSWTPYLKGNMDTPNSLAPSKPLDTVSAVYQV